MRIAFRLTGSVVLLWLAASANAGQVLWTLNDITFSDGGTASGSFIFNADSGTACSTGASPCGTFSDVDITTTTGSALSAATYTFVCGTDDPSCDAVSPDSTEVQFLTSNSSSQEGNQAIAFFFTAPGPLPPAGLTDSGGTIDMSNTTVGVIGESYCSTEDCGPPTGSSRASVTGTVTGVAIPEPGTWGLMLTSLSAILILRRVRAAAR